MSMRSRPGCGPTAATWLPATGVPEPSFLSADAPAQRRALFAQIDRYALRQMVALLWRPGLIMSFSYR